MSLKLEMLPFDAKSIERTCTTWVKDLDTCEGVFPVDVHAIVEYIQKNSIYEHSTLDSIAYGIFPNSGTSKSEASAVVKVIISKAGKKWIKMIDCQIRPQIEDNASRESASDIQKIMEIYSAAIVGSLRLTNTHKVKTVKVYGRNNALLRMLTLTAGYLKEQLTEHALPLKVSIEGRWLVVNAK